MKHLKTLITLFLLVIGTGASWAEFKDVTLDFTKSWATSLSPGGSPSDVYVTDINADGEATLSTSETEGYLAHILGYYHSSTYGLYYEAKVKVPVKAGMYQITLGMSDYGGKIAVSDGTKVLATINNMGGKYAADNRNVGVGIVSVESDCVLEIYASENAKKVHFPYISVSEAKFVSDFEINLNTSVAPTLPAGVTQIAYPAYSVGYHANKHGSSWYAIRFNVDGPVKITLGGCQFNQNSDFKWDEGAVLDASADPNATPLCSGFGTQAAGCSGSGSYEYTGGPACLNVYCGEYCPYIKVEKLVEPGHVHSFDAEWTQTESHHYHACTEAGCDISDYSAVTGDDAVYVAYGEHEYATIIASVDDVAYYTCQTCEYVNSSRKADADAAIGVIKLIDAIGDVVYSTECYEKIQTALNAYNALTETQKGLVTNYDKLTKAQATYKELTPVLVPARTALWDWMSSRTTDLIYEESNIDHASGIVHSDVPGVNLEVNAISGLFRMEDAGNVNSVVLSAGCTINVPIRRLGDKVTVVCGDDQNFYTIGADKKPSTGDEMTYTATQKDFEKGYVAITATKEARFFSIEVEQKQFKSVLPMITLNSAGWASFTSLIKDQVVAVPAGATAYVATGADDEYVTLKKVTRFTYGEGVFIKGDPNAELYANAVGGTSDVPKVAGNVTIGCTSDQVVFSKSNAYVVATNNKTKKAGFFKVNTSLTVPAGKAFLYAPNTEAKELSIVFEDGEEVTGIESVLAVESEKKAPTVFYNLAGQVVGKDYKGIVIGNDGKKYMK